MSFSQSVDHYLRLAADHTPAFPVYAAGFTIPFWTPSLAQISHFAGQITPILVMVATLVKVYGAAREWAEKRRTAGKPLVPGGRMVLGIAATLGIVAVLAWVTATPGKAAPAVAAMPAAAATSKRKRPADDDDDDDDDQPDVEGKSKLYALAVADIGIQEATPSGRPNPVVQAKFAHVKGFNPKTVDCRAVPWCAVEINDLCFRAGVPGTNSAMARSFLYWGKETTEPKAGDVVVFWRGSRNDGETGHVAVFERFEGDYVVHIGGNQSDAVTRTKTHKRKVLQYRRHMALWESRQMHGAALQGAGISGNMGTAATDQQSTGTDLAKETIDSVREPLTQVSDYLPGKWQTYAYVLCTVLLLVGTAIVVYERMQYRKKIGW